jgi:hypothetical protein
MRYTGNADLQITQTPRDDWLALFDCPDRECSAVASASGANELGPYRGSCSSGPARLLAEIDSKHGGEERGDSHWRYGLFEQVRKAHGQQRDNAMRNVGL